MTELVNDYAGTPMMLPIGAVEHCDHCTSEITKTYIRVEADSDFIYCLECGEEEN